MATVNQGKSSTGLDANVAATLSYLAGIITGIIFFLLEKENKYVRFHAMQSIIFSLVFGVLSITVSVVPGINLALPLITLAQLAIWILLMVKAYQGEKFKLPVAGDIAEKSA